MTDFIVHRGRQLKSTLLLEYFRKVFNSKIWFESVRKENDEYAVTFWRTPSGAQVCRFVMALRDIGCHITRFDFSHSQDEKQKITFSVPVQFYPKI